METTSKSRRAEVAASIAEAVHEMGLDEVYAGGTINPADPEHNYYTVLFCKARILDGSVRVYGRSSITVRWQTAIRDLPRNGQIFCRSAEEAIKVLRDQFFYDTPGG
jgi:hypothetical protein